MTIKAGTDLDFKHTWSLNFIKTIMQTILKIRNNIFFLLKRQILFIDKLGVRHTTNLRKNRKKQQKTHHIYAARQTSKDIAYTKDLKRF